MGCRKLCPFFVFHLSLSWITRPWPLLKFCWQNYSNGVQGVIVLMHGQSVERFRNVWRVFVKFKIFSWTLLPVVQLTNVLKCFTTVMLTECVWTQLECSTVRVCLDIREMERSVKTVSKRSILIYSFFIPFPKFCTKRAVQILCFKLFCLLLLLVLSFLLMF